MATQRALSRRDGRVLQRQNPERFGLSAFGVSLFARAVAEMALTLRGASLAPCPGGNRMPAGFIATGETRILFLFFSRCIHIWT